MAFAESHSHTFLRHLQRNVDEYRISHFSWNIRNIDHNNYVSLRTMENEKDRAFKESLRSHSPDGKQLASEHGAMYREKEPESLLQNMSPGFGKSRSGNDPLKLQKREVEHPQMMLYGDKTGNNPRTLQKRSAEHPQMMMYGEKTGNNPRTLQKRSAEHPQMMMYGDKTGNNPRKLQKREVVLDMYRHMWISIADSLSLRFPMRDHVYFNSWNERIVLFKNNTLNKNEFTGLFLRLPLQEMLEELSLTNVFQNIFWPFSFDQAFMNQRLALLGMSGISTNKHKQKEIFYAELEKHQTIKIPVEEDRVVLSFDHPDLVEGLNRSGLLEMTTEYVDADTHLYTLEEQNHIKYKVQAAMDMINSTNPELFQAIHQVIGCIAFYKAEYPGFAGGTISSALGVIWQDPSAYREQSVAHYAEQIVHEFIHSSLFLADMVHGTYIDRSLLSQAKVYSPVRKELRDFDKTFHASYVTTGVIIFQSRAGNLEKAKTYAGTLRVAVDGLIATQNEVGVLNESGVAMLQAMDDVLTVIRMQ